jgi:hypothetical protein
MKKILFLILLFTSLVYSRGDVNRASRWTLISATVLESIYDINVGTTASDNVIRTFKIIGDADSDGSATTSETLQLTLTPNAIPTSSTWAFTSTQGAGYSFDKSVGIMTTAPDKPLEINSATGLGMRLTYNDADGTAANYVDYEVTSSGDATITPSGGDVTIAGNTISTTFNSVSLKTDVSGDNWQFLGFQAGASNTGTRSNGFGYLSLQNNTGAESNGFGYRSLRYNTSASSNGFGYRSLLHNQGANNTAMGGDAFNTFNENTGGNKTFDNTDVDATGDSIVVTAHGFGSVGDYVNLTYTQGTSAITGLTNGAVYQFQIQHADTLVGRSTNITAAGSGTGHTFTPQYVYTNSTAIGYNAEPTASNQIMLGDANVTNVVTAGTLTVGEFTQYFTVYASATTVGGTAPTPTTIETFRGLLFNANAEEAFIEFEVPDDWNGTSDMELKIYGFPTAGDAVADGEVVEFDATYRSIAEGEAYDNGTAVTISPNYTQSGGGTDKALIELEATIAYTGGNQPLTKGDVMGFKINRDVTTSDTYSGDFNVIKFEIAYTANTFSLHN